MKIMMTFYYVYFYVACCKRPLKSGRVSHHQSETLYLTQQTFLYPFILADLFLNTAKMKGLNQILRLAIDAALLQRCCPLGFHWKHLYKYPRSFCSILSSPISCTRLSFFFSSPVNESSNPAPERPVCTTDSFAFHGPPGPTVCVFLGGGGFGLDSPQI